jgi:hypothetical protein
MTVTSAPNRARYVANGATTAFPYGFRILDRTHLRVSLTDAVTSVETVLVIDVNYSVSGVNNVLGGTVTLTVAPSSGTIVTILPSIPVEQPTEFRNQSSAFRAAQEKAYDRGALIAGRHEELLARAMALHPAVAPGVSATVPLPVAGKALGWNAGGTALENITPPTGATGPKGDPGSIPVYATKAALLAAIPSPTDGTIAKANDTGAIYQATSGVFAVVFDASRIVDVKSRGAKGDGVTDDTAIIQAALAEAIADPMSPKALYFPRGIYVLTGVLHVAGVRGFFCYGDGSFTTQLLWTGAGGADSCMWRCENTHYCEWHDFYVKVNSSLESAFLMYTNGARVGTLQNTMNQNRFHNIYVDGVSGTNMDYGWNMALMPTFAGTGTVTAAVGGLATFSAPPANAVISTSNDRTHIFATLNGTVSVSGGAGAATFSVSQASALRDGMHITVAGVKYQVNSFNGTTGATLTKVSDGTNAPNFGASAFTSEFSCSNYTLGGTTCTLTPYNQGSAFGKFSASSWTYNSGSDNNNDLGAWYGCTVSLYKLAGWRIGHSQSKMHRMYACEFDGGGVNTGLPRYGVLQVDGSFRWHYGGGGGNRNQSRSNSTPPTMGADFYLTKPSDNILIEGGDFEGSARFIETSAAAGASFQTIARGTRYSGDELHADGYGVLYQWNGPLVLDGNIIGGGTAPVPKMKVGGRAFRAVGNNWESYGSVTTDVFDFSPVTTDQFDCTIEDNTFADGSGFGEVFTKLPDGATAPRVMFGYEYTTANTAATTIRDLTVAHPNQVVKLYFGDPYTVLQSGNRIQLQGSASWGTTASPIPMGSSITLVYKQSLGAWVEMSRQVFAGPTDIVTTLVPSIEGAAGGFVGCVYGVYDARYNVDVSAAGKVIGWSDARGIMYGPTAVLTASSVGPTWDGTNKYLVFSGAVDEHLRYGTVSNNLFVTGSGTVTVASAAATFSTSQAGRIADGTVVKIKGVAYTVSAFNGTTGATLVGAPNVTAAKFTHEWLAGSAGVVVVAEVSSTGGELGGMGSISQAKVAVELRATAANIEAQTRLGAISTATGGTLTNGGATRSLYIGRRTQTAGNIVLGVSKNNGTTAAGDGNEIPSPSTGDTAFKVEAITVGGRSGDATPIAITAKIRAIIFLTVEPTAAIRTAIRTWSVAQHTTP